MEMDTLPNGKSATTPTTAVSNGATTPASKLSRLTESLKLEHQFLRVPFEHYKKTIRANHRAIEKEITAVISSVSNAASAAANNNNNNEDVDMCIDVDVQRLTSLVSRLQWLKRKLEEGKQQSSCKLKDAVLGLIIWIQRMRKIQGSGIIRR